MNEILQTCGIVRETDKAVLAQFSESFKVSSPDEVEVWLPKSQIEILPTEGGWPAIDAPLWLIEAKGLDHAIV